MFDAKHKINKMAQFRSVQVCIAKCEIMSKDCEILQSFAKLRHTRNAEDLKLKIYVNFMTCPEHNFS